MENPADVILVSRLTGKVGSIACHVVTDHTYISLHTYYPYIHTCNRVPTLCFEPVLRLVFKVHSFIQDCLKYGLKIVF